jgi:hypothetical protein
MSLKSPFYEGILSAGCLYLHLFHVAMDDEATANITVLCQKNL